ncbi:MAG: hypothetical protein K9K82_03335 [Desulfobacteraceae bacterium]|nr:hypothetical protein [Desulfobacteraceae bacterium]
MTDIKYREYLFIDLAHGRTESRDVPEAAEAEYPYGAALATYLLNLHQPAGVDPLSPESVVVLAPGPLAGLPYPGATRLAVSGKSSLTGCWTGGSMGGEFAWALARSGWSAVVLQGRADSWVYLFLDEGRAYLRPANSLIGKPLPRAQQELKAIWGHETAVLGVGPAGEAQLDAAMLMDSLPVPLLRGGLGAVFGAKNLKAIAARPYRAIKVDQPTTFLKAAEPMIKSMGESKAVQDLVRASTGALRKLNEIGALPAKNFQDCGVSDEWLDDIEQLKTKEKACPGCPLGCMKIFSIEKNVAATAIPLLPEHVWAMGPLVGLESIQNTLGMLRDCFDYGLDPISIGGAIAWTAECIEKGLDLGLGFSDAAGFGQGEWLEEWPKNLLNFSEWQELLGHGAWRAGREAGDEAFAHVVHYRGQELSYPDPRVNSVHLSFLSPALEIPIDSQLLEGSVSNQDICKKIIARENELMLLATLGICPWVAEAQPDFLEHLMGFSAEVGLSWSADELKRWGVNLAELIRAFDCREGWRQEQEDLAERFFQTELQMAEKIIPPLDRQNWLERISVYNALRGWSPEGRPSEPEV